MDNWFASLRELTLFSMMLRILLAIIAGGIIGFERERKGRPAGFRTYMLVALGASMTMILSQYLNLMFDGAWAETAAEIGIKTDVSRFGAQVINGVGFLGAGTIIVTERQEVKGLTTAAGLWASACMGLAAGAGFSECVLVGFVLIVGCMCLLPYFESAVMSKAYNMVIYTEMDTIEHLSGILSFIKREDIVIHDVEIDKDPHEHTTHVNALIGIRLPIKVPHAEVLAALSTLEGVISIEEV